MGSATAFYLPQGMRFVVAEDHAAPVVAVGLWVRAGVCDEPEGRRGIAHFLEHMMFRGSANVAPEEHMRRIQSLGGQANGWAGIDETVFHEIVPSAAVEEVFRLEADRFAGPSLSAEHTEIERKVVLEELHIHENQPAVRALRLIRKAVARGHPYALDALGRSEDLHAVTADDLAAFYRRCYRPERMFATVVGDIDPARAERLARRHFGPWAPDEAEDAADRTPPFQPEVGRLSARMPLQVPVVARVHGLPPTRRTDRPALRILEMMLAEGNASLIHEALVSKRRLCVAAGAVSVKGIHGGILAPFGAFLPPGRHRRRRRVMRRICDRLAEKGPDPERLARCVKQARRRRAEQEYDPVGRMRLLGLAELQTEGFQTYERELEDLAAVTPERVRALAADVFAPANTLELDVTPERMPWWMWPAGLLSRLWRR